MMCSQYEFDKALSVGGEYDVIVCGSGPSGICAALSAARMGTKVALIERYGIIGGNLTAGHVGPILGSVAAGTMTDEIMQLLGVPDNDMIGEVGVAHDVEYAKIKLTQLVSKEHMDIYLQTMVTEVIQEDNKVKGVVISGKEGLRILWGKIIIDATGDGDVAYFAGVPYEKGRDADKLMQPVTLEFTIDQVDEERAITCIGDVDDVQFEGERFLDFTARCAEKGILPENLAAVRLHRTTIPGERRVNTTQVNGIDATNTSQIFEAESQLREQISILMEFFHKYLPGYENCKLTSSANTLGTRESRRMMGEYRMEVDDIICGRKFDDVIVHDAEFIVDIHNPSGSGQAEAKIQYAKPYDIPYRALIPLKVDNLLLTGRSISGSHKAMASYRVMTICMALGQAAGTAAALCVKKGCTPRKLHFSEVQKALQNAGANLFD